MIGSAATTTVAALDTGGKLTWQNVTIVAIGFTVTLSAAFTGYYKYRERSYFLLQTADAIEEEANAVTLGIGPYKNFGPDQEQQALKLFTQRVEDHRNEQRRRQQQLDQPADQATPTGASPSA
ncbi:SLATT domain-containing protein [Streptomyces mirabilis]